MKTYRLEPLDRQNILDVLGYQTSDNFDIEDIVNKDTLLDAGFKYAIIYNFDSVISDEIKNIEIDMSNILEARFFNDKKEIRVFRDEDKIMGTIFLETGSNYIDKTVLLYPRYREQRYADKLYFKEYIDYDKDNQAYIRYIKPSKLYFKEGK